MRNGEGNRQGDQRRGQWSDAHASQIQQDRGQQKQDLNPAQQNQREQGATQQRADANRQQQDQQEAILENNRGGADPTGGQVIREGGGPGENIAPRRGEDLEIGPDTGQELEEARPGSMGQSAEQPAEGPRSGKARRNSDGQAHWLGCDGRCALSGAVQGSGA